MFLIVSLLFLIVSQRKTKGFEGKREVCEALLRLENQSTYAFCVPPHGSSILTNKAYSKIKATKSITRRFVSEGKRVGVFCILCFLYPLIEDFNREDKSFAYKTKDNNSFLCFLCSLKRKDNKKILTQALSVRSFCGGCEYCSKRHTFSFTFFTVLIYQIKFSLNLKKFIN